MVQQHAEEVAVLRNTRSALVSGPHVRLHQLGRLDDRLAAHLDGLAVAGDYGTKMAVAALERPGRGEAFTATVRAIEDGDVVGLERLLAMAEAVPGSLPGVISAFGWVTAASLRGISNSLLNSSSPLRRLVGLAACDLHQVDPGTVVDAALKDDDAALRARAIRLIAHLGQVDKVSACMSAIGAEDAHCAFEAARSAALLGNRSGSLVALQAFASARGPWRSWALGLLLKLQSPTDAYSTLKALAQDPASIHLLIQASAQLVTRTMCLGLSSRCKT